MTEYKLETITESEHAHYCGIPKKIIEEAGPWDKYLRKHLDETARGSKRSTYLVKQALTIMQNCKSRECVSYYCHVFNNALFILFGLDSIDNLEKEGKKE